MLTWPRIVPCSGAMAVEPVEQLIGSGQISAHPSNEAVESAADIQSTPMVGIGLRASIPILLLTLFQLFLTHRFSHQIFRWKFHETDRV